MVKPKNFHINTRTIGAPLAAFTMAGLLFVYSRISIQAAKRNAQQHREADGGQISWRNESLRRHGVMEKPGEKRTVPKLVSEAVGEAKQEAMGVMGKKRGEEEKIRARRRKEVGE